MCGFAGIATTRGLSPTPDDRAIEAMRDRLASRGPDGASLWRWENLVLGFRRLAVIDPTPAGDQPMVSPDGRFVLVYNGELYNDAELRDELIRLGERFSSECDTETVLLTLARWGLDGLDRLRGMYALAWYDRREHTMVLARDPLGIKPLYYTVRAQQGGTELVFASSIRAILEHPDIAPEPDPVTISAYLSTIRTTLGSRTLFGGIQTLRPGESIRFDLSGGEPIVTRRDAWDRIKPIVIEPGSAEAAVRGCLEESVRRHLRADVPVCTLLSGGLDSSIIAALARPSADPLRTYCSGAQTDADDDDFAHARAMSAQLGSVHTEVPVTRELFAKRWPEMIAQQGVPLSTPNEVAIYEVALRLRGDGQIVALSGEGADELFGGYALPTSRAVAYIAAGDEDPGCFELDANAWIARTLKPGLLAPGFWRRCEADESLVGHYRDEFATLADRADGGDPLGVHLAFQRRINLAGLLGRLDTATMLAGVEGRTPIADVEVARLAESLPSSARFVAAPEGADATTEAQTKIVLRRAFADVIPQSVLDRPKASFPLPFERWVVDQAGVLTTSTWAREVFTPVALATVAARPAELWHLAWPMINIALWGEGFWGDGSC